MHEIGVVRQMIATIDSFCKENNVDKVSEIVVEIGELSLVIPKYVTDIYPIVVEGTKFQDTKLIIETVPGMAECDECDEIFNVIETKGYCPNCGSFEKTVITGEDFNIKEIHIAE